MSQNSFARKANKSVLCSLRWHLLFCMGWVVALFLFCISTPIAHIAYAAQVEARAQMAGRTPAVGGSATSTPVAGPTRATVTVNGSGWQGVPDRTAVTFGYSTDPSCTSSYTAAAVEQAGSMSSGAFNGWFRWPDATPTGAYTVCASIGSAMAAAGSYTVLSATPPQLSISASTLNVGQKAVATGSNFLPAQTRISLVLQQLNGGTSLALGTLTSDANGAFSQTFTIPTNLTGPVVLIANGGSGTPPILTASVTFIVYVTPGTPTPTPGASPTPSPTPQHAPTPTPNTVTPTAIQTQGQKQAATPAPIPTQPTSVGSTTTPTTGNEVTQRPASPPTSTTGSRNGTIMTVALIAGTLFLVLVATIAGLLFWKRRTATKQRTAPFKADAQAVQVVQTMPSWNPIRDPFSSAAQDPFATPNTLRTSARTPARGVPTIHEGTGKYSISGASAGYAVRTPARGVPTIHEGTGQRTGYAASAGYSRGTPGGYPDVAGYSRGDEDEDDLLHDPLFVAIMQQTRSGLFVLPGKEE